MKKIDIKKLGKVRGKRLSERLDQRIQWLTMAYFNAARGREYLKELDLAVEIYQKALEVLDTQELKNDQLYDRVAKAKFLALRVSPKSLKNSSKSTNFDFFNFD